MYVQKVNVVDKVTGQSADIINCNGCQGIVTLSPGHVSVANSTYTALDADEVWIGEAEDVVNFGVIQTIITPSHSSAADGFSIEFSVDGITWDDGDVYTIEAASSKVYSFQPSAKYYRIKYVNGTIPQTYLRLQTILKPYYVKPSSHRIQDSIIVDDDAELVKAVLTGESDTGVFYNTKVDSTGRLKVVSQPYEYSIAEGTIPDHQPVRRFGLNTNIGTSLETICPESKLYVYLTSAEVLSIVSTSANDDDGNTGVNSIFIQGLDTNYVLQSEIVIMNGTTPVNTTKSYLRVLAVYSNSVGTNAANVGVITVSNNAATNVLGTIPVGEGRCNSAIFTVPAGYTFYFTSWYGSENSSKGTDISLWERGFGNGGWQLLRLFTLKDDLFENELKAPLVFAEKTDIEVRAKATLAGANVAAGFYGWMET